MLEFLTLTMLPIVTAYEQELNRKILTREQRRSGLHFKFDMDALLRADAATQAEVDYKAVRSGWKTVDEIRNARNLPALPKGIGKYALVSQDLATLDYTVNDKPKVLMRGVNEGGGPSQSQSQTLPQTQSNQDEGKDGLGTLSDEQFGELLATISAAANAHKSQEVSTPEGE